MKALSALEAEQSPISKLLTFSDLARILDVVGRIIIIIIIIINPLTARVVVAHRWFWNQFSPFFPVLHRPLGPAELQACPFPDETTSGEKKHHSFYTFHTSEFSPDIINSFHETWHSSSCSLTSRRWNDTIGQFKLRHLKKWWDQREGEMGKGESIRHPPARHIQIKQTNSNNIFDWSSLMEEEEQQQHRAAEGRTIWS